MACPTTVHDTVCVEAEVTIMPGVTVGDIMTFCVGGPIIGGCPGMLEPACTFRVGQQICVQVPLTFDATAEAQPTGIVCGTPGIGGCPNTTACTHTIGYYRNHPDETDALIIAAGGEIVLGINGSGLSYTVTPGTSANDVLDFNTPSPPAPEDPPFGPQYQNLYAQLLAANLNVLNGATCEYAETWIAAANTFLAASPPGGMDGAPFFQEALELFNSGSAPGCPPHCD